MAGTVWLFIDEFGNPNFGRNGSAYFGLASIATEHPHDLSRALDELRHNWLSEQHIQRGYFHARDDCWAVRQAVFELCATLPIVRSDVLALTKVRVDKSRRPPPLLYSLALRQLFLEVGRALSSYSQVIIVAAEWKPLVSDLRGLIREALTAPGDDGAVLWRGAVAVHQMPAAAHAGLQLADYVSWASNRARAQGDDRWLPYIRNRRAWSDHAVFRE